MQQQILSLVQSYQNDDYPHGLGNDIVEIKVDETDQHLVVNIVLPYPAKSLALPLQGFLYKALYEKSGEALGDKALAVQVNCSLQQPPCFKQIKNIILVASGKGGVGKSTTAVNLALSMAKEGASVGLLDADVYGPSIPLMMGMEGQRPVSHDGKIMEPLVGFGIKVNSIGFLIDPQDAAVWRGPMASSALTQLIGETNWGELDYLVVDMPPGTGDIQLTISQKFPCTGAVVVTTPQNIALADAEKGVAMFSKVNIPVLGIIENMSYFVCSDCGSQQHIFGKDGAVAMAKKHGTELLGQVPLEQQNRENGDKGTPTAIGECSLALIYHQIARKLTAQLHWTQQNNAAPSGPEISFVDD